MLYDKKRRMMWDGISVQWLHSTRQNNKTCSKMSLQLVSGVDHQTTVVSVQWCTGHGTMCLCLSRWCAASIFADLLSSSNRLYLQHPLWATRWLTHLLLLLPVLFLSSCSFSPRPLRDDEVLPVRTHRVVGGAIAEEEEDGKREKVGIRQSSCMQ